MTFARFILRLAAFLSVPLFVALLTYKFLNRSFRVPLEASAEKSVLIELAAGRTIKEVGEELEEKGVLRHWWTLWLLARMTQKDSRIQAGEYEMNGSMTPKEMLQKLTSGDMYKRKIIVKEGAKLIEIGSLLEIAELMPSAKFLEAARDRKTLNDLSIKNESVEGYLFPETYYFSRPVMPREIIWRMLEEGEKHWPPEYSEQAAKLNLSRHEVLTLASIIEGESGNVEEQPLIASVFHNRLSKGIKLQSDATVIYGMPDFDGTLRREDKENPHPYNTYVNYGLPPGPICNPGETAIHAALFPKESEYLYFLPRGDGTHVFSVTFQEHQAAMDQYVKGKVRGDGVEAPHADAAPSSVPTKSSLSFTIRGN